MVWIPVVQPQNTLSEDSCSFHDGTSVFNVHLTRSQPGKDCGTGSDQLVEEIKVAQEKTSELNSVFVQLQSSVLKLMEANAALSERLRLTENELRATKLALALNNGGMEFALPSPLYFYYNSEVNKM